MTDGRGWGEQDGIHTPPDGMAVEELAIAMASEVGVAWIAADQDTKRRIRVMANVAVRTLRPG